jgi:hypothetical protein
MLNRQLLTYCHLTAIILVIFLSFFIANLIRVYAAALGKCKIRAEILEVVPSDKVSMIHNKHIKSDKNISLKIRILTSVAIPENYGACRYKSNDEETIVVAVPSQKDLAYLKKGTQLELKYKHYIGMGPYGLVEDSSWEFIRIILPASQL